MGDAICFGDIALPSNAKHEYGNISVSASFKVTNNQRTRCYNDTFVYILIRLTGNPSKAICFNGNFTVSGTVDKSFQTVRAGVYVAAYESYAVKSVTVTFSYKTLK